MKQRILVSTIAALVPIALGMSAALAADKFQKLTGPQIRSKLAGMEITDEVHSTDLFARNGTLTSYAMSRKASGKWRVQKDELCLDRGKAPGSGCYEVWLSGTKVELRTSGSGLPFEGILQKPTRHE